MQLLNALPPAQREVMAFIIDEFEPVEIAALFGKTPAAVRQNLRAARQKLKSAVKGEHAAETLPRPKESPAKEDLG
jgi:DNA-directed RNA polymerase specialized sigma24 family protein